MWLMTCSQELVESRPSCGAVLLPRSLRLCRRFWDYFGAMSLEVINETGVELPGPFESAWVDDRQMNMTTAYGATRL